MPKKPSRSTRSNTSSSERKRSLPVPPMSGIAKDGVGEVVQSFVESGTKILAVNEDPDGTFTVTPS